jgi:hypothetical protein
MRHTQVLVICDGPAERCTTSTVAGEAIYVVFPDVSGVPRSVCRLSGGLMEVLNKMIVRYHIDEVLLLSARDY